jgi:hypothetical protein
MNTKIKNTELILINIYFNVTQFYSLFALFFPDLKFLIIEFTSLETGFIISATIIALFYLPFSLRILIYTNSLHHNDIFLHRLLR